MLVEIHFIWEIKRCEKLAASQLSYRFSDSLHLVCADYSITKEFKLTNVIVYFLDTVHSDNTEQKTSTR